MSRYYKCTCINCGAQVKQLFKKYSATVLKLANCVSIVKLSPQTEADILTVSENCKNVADKYIEYDPVIVIIDLILLRKEAYRHILYNTEFKSHWKLAVMLQMMEVYSEWILTTPKHKAPDDNSITYNTGDVQFYLLSLRILFRTLCSLAVVLLLTLVYNMLFKKHSSANTPLKTVWKAIILSNFGWFLLLPSLIWDNSVQEFHLTFVSLYTTLSQLLAYSVVCSCTKLWSIIVIVISYNFKISSDDLYDRLYNFAINEYYYLFQ